ncbi:MAG: HAD-IC family P-type ATPase, partial [Proteobacteria bacterium]|nr:HAD-IC family P-type ATPase [Pseudomonadota bacterium]
MDKNEQTSPTSWFALDTGDVVRQLDSDVVDGLSQDAARERLVRYGPNELKSEPPPSKVAVMMHQVVDPMNLMLLAVAVISFAIGERSTGLLVLALVVLNVVLGARQEMKAKAAVDALSKLQIPVARVVRGGSTIEIPAPNVVQGDIVLIESGDLVPADGRVIASATLETQEAALTGESAPISKQPAIVAGDDVALGDRSNMVFQNTSVTRGTGTMIVVATGMSTEMGRIATMLSSVDRKRSPLQRELDGLTKLLGVIAWSAVAVIVAIGLARGTDASDLLLLGTAMAISAIPTGLPTFVQAMLSYGAKQLAEAKAVVKNLTDVETLGSTSAINTDKTGTLTMNEMTASMLFHGGSWFTIEGSGYDKTGAIRSVAGEPDHDFTAMAYALVLDSDAVVGDDGSVIGDPTEAALVVLAAKLGVDAEETRRAYPRLGEVPFDSAYKFMTTLHRVPIDGEEKLILLTKGAPDVVLARCSEASTSRRGYVPIDEAIESIDDANTRIGSDGLRVLSLAFRIIESWDEDAALADPMSFVRDLRFVSLIGIVDPLRPSSKEAVRIAHNAGIDVRMITGDHACKYTVACGDTDR